jgi:NAD(P)-dependent dehydrogenase (short-subunit alcohol dehydrogenase family)
VSNLAGRKAVITGGASGIGLAFARRVVDAGGTVVLVDVDDQRAEAAAHELGAGFVIADVGDREAVEHAFAIAAETLDGLDLAFVNAGIAANAQEPEQFTTDAWERVRRVNLDGVVWGVTAAVPHLTDASTIIATASLAGLVAFPPDPMYTATKHAVVGFVRSLAPTLVPRGIRLAAVCPGFARTPLVTGVIDDAIAELGVPLLEAEDVAAAVERMDREAEPGSCWIVQPGREPLPYGFRGVPGPRAGSPQAPTA